MDIKKSIDISKYPTKSYDYKEDYKEELEINSGKAKEIIGEEKWNEFIKDTLNKWINGEYYSSKVEKFLKKEGILATKRENSLDNLLDD